MIGRPSRELRELALLHSIQLSYLNAEGKRRRASVEGILATLRALGVAIDSQEGAPEALRASRAAICRRGVEPVTVWWERGPRLLRIRVEESEAAASIRTGLVLETGEQLEIAPDASRDIRRMVVDGEHFVEKELRFAESAIPFGYHRLSASWNGSSKETLLLVAPEKAYAPGRDERMWGLFAPLYALRTARDWGCGDLTDLANLIRETASFGAAGIATLPLLAAFLSEPFEPSPYAPVSRLFWNELFLDPVRIPGFESSTRARELVASEGFLQEQERLRAMEIIDYRGVAAHKRRVIEILAEEFFAREDATHRPDLERFLSEQPRAEAYARFRAALEHGRWPGASPEGGLIELKTEEEPARRYHLFSQWQLIRQLESIAALARSSGFGLYLDFPLGVHGGGFDSWVERDTFAQASAGAPPDSLFTGGQNWGFPPMHPEKLREDGYQYLIESLRAPMRYAGVLRFDHVMGLHRLYWIPGEVSAKEGVYVRYRSEEMFAILTIESHRHRTMIVGEDLGTVPAIVRRRMERHGIRRMYVLQYEIGPHGHVGSPPRGSVASLNTHDMPPFAGFWQGDDITERARHGHVPDLERERESRRITTLSLAAFLSARGLLDPERTDAQAVFDACAEFLAKSDTELLLINAEDLWLTTEAQNLPGTHREHPNWRRRLAVSLEDLTSAPELANRLRQLDHWRKQGRPS